MDFFMNKNKIFGSVIVIYIVCLILRLFEYFVLKTDYSVIGEAVFHKLAGIFILFLAAGYFNYDLKESGFSGDGAIKKLLAGIFFSLSCFAVAYFAEIAIAKNSNAFSGVGLYVTSYSVNGNLGKQTAMFFFIICIAGNIINVVMEEGIFRGLFLTRLQKKYSFLTSALISSILFGLWHGAGPLRSYIYGECSLAGLLMNCLILILSSSLVGAKFVLLTKLTGSVYMSMGDHFVNNTIVNILHVLTIHGADSYQIIRISIAQTISFIIVLILFLLRKKTRIF